MQDYHYQLITMASSLRTTMHVITMSDEDATAYESAIEIDRKSGRAIVAKYAAPEWRRGDVIGVTNAEAWGYRNAGKFLWSGTEVVDLHYKVDDYGSIPPMFPADEFNAMYWEGYVVHNELVFAKFDEHIRNNVNEICKQIKEGTFDAESVIFQGSEVIINRDDSDWHKEVPVIFKFNGNTWAIILGDCESIPFKNEIGLFNYMDEWTVPKFDQGLLENDAIAIAREHGVTKEYMLFRSW